MKLFRVWSVSIAAMLATASLYAIDRDAAMIDAVWIEGASFDYADYFGGHITGENMIADSNDKWAVLAGVLAGTGSIDNGSDFDTIGLELGLKYYLLPLTSIAGIGSYAWNNADEGDDFDTGAFTARIKQRLISADEPISPYLKLEAALQFIDFEDSDSQFTFRAMAGCDVMMSDTFALVFEGGYSESDNLDDGPDTEDGWLLRIGMQYYWGQE